MSKHKALYNSSAWQALRRQQLAAHPLCRMHEAIGQVVEATVVDHIRPHRGELEAFLDASNLQSLCKRCHDSHKQAQEVSGDGILRGAGHDGRPLDLAHPWFASSWMGGSKSSPPNRARPVSHNRSQNVEMGRGGLGDG